MDHRGESGYGKNITRDFDGAFFCGALYFLDVLGAGIWADVPDVGENGARVRDQESGKLTVIIPGFDDGLFVDFFGDALKYRSTGGT